MSGYVSRTEDAPFQRAADSDCAGWGTIGRYSAGSEKQGVEKREDTCKGRIARTPPQKGGVLAIYEMLDVQSYVSDFFLNSEGLMSNCFLKHTLKYFALLKPV